MKGGGCFIYFLVALLALKLNSAIISNVLISPIDETQILEWRRAGGGGNEGEEGCTLHMAQYVL